MPKERWEGYNEIQAFGFRATNKEMAKLERFKDNKACRPLFLVFEKASRLAIEKVKDL